MMTFGQAISTVFGRYGQFTGVARRAEYWWWILFVTTVDFLLSGIDSRLNPQSAVAMISTTWVLVVLLPTLAVAVRRLRDAGLSWRYLFLALIPILGAVALIVLLSLPSKKPAGNATTPRR
jgi:uncharacterized membrane protein YhaH (DUF805 family)